jgi:hypothetical protein
MEQFLSRKELGRLGLSCPITSTCQNAPRTPIYISIANWCWCSSTPWVTHDANVGKEHGNPRAVTFACETFIEVIVVALERSHVKYIGFPRHVMFVVLRYVALSPYARAWHFLKVKEGLLGHRNSSTSLNQHIEIGISSKLLHNYFRVVVLC